MSRFKSGRWAIGVGYVIGGWIYGLIYLLSNSEQYNYIGGNVWSLLGRALAWPYWVVVAVV